MAADTPYARWGRFLDLITEVEEASRVRGVLGQIVALDQAAPDLTDQQLHDRLRALARQVGGSL